MMTSIMAKKKSQAQIDKIVRDTVKRRIKALSGRKGKKAKKRVTKAVKKGMKKHTKKQFLSTFKIHNKDQAVIWARALDQFLKSHG